MLALARGDVEAAARLMGARDRLFAQFGSRDDALTRFFYDKALARLRAAVEAGDLGLAWAAGSAIGLDEAFQYARSVVQPERGGPRRGRPAAAAPV